jgi:heme-degrading monooxygenase HmoA
MIARVWRGWTRRDNADAYENLLRATILPGIHRVTGYKGAQLLRADSADEVEFVTITYFDSMEAVQGFAGDHREGAVILPEAMALLSRFDQTSLHYEVAASID